MQRLEGLNVFVAVALEQVDVPKDSWRKGLFSQQEPSSPARSFCPRLSHHIAPLVQEDMDLVIVGLVSVFSGFLESVSVRWEKNIQI